MKRGDGSLGRLVVETFRKHPKATSYELAAITRLEPSQVRSALRHARLKLARARKPNLMDWERQAITDAANEKRIALASEFGVCVNTIQNIWRRAGVERQRFGTAL